MCPCGDYGPSDPGPAVHGRAEVAGDGVVRGEKWRGEEIEATVGSRVLGEARPDEGIGYGCGSPFSVERSTAVVRCVSHVDLSALVATAHHQIRTERDGVGSL